MLHKSLTKTTLVLIIVLTLSILIAYSLSEFKNQSSYITYSEKELLPKEHQTAESFEMSSLSTNEATQEGEFAKSLKTQIKSAKELPEIAAAALKESGVDDPNKFLPSFTILSNDGEYSAVDIRDANKENVLFLVKRDGIWRVVHISREYSNCSELAPVIKKYSIRKDFIPCK